MDEKRARILALQHDRDRERLIALATRQINRTGLAVLQAVYDAYRDNGHGLHVRVEQALLDFQLMMTSAMTATHLAGRLRSYGSLEKHTGHDALIITASREAFEQAKLSLQQKAKVSAEQVAGIEQIYSPMSGQVMRNVDYIVEARARRAIHTATRERLHVRGAQALLRNELAKEGVTPRNSYLLKTVVRTQTQLAYGAGRWNANQDPAINKILWGYQYVTVGDDRVRPKHAALDNKKKPKGDPFWQTGWPPNGYNCRCSTLEIWNDDAEAGQIDTIPYETTMDEQVWRKPRGKKGFWETREIKVQPGPDSGWQFNPGTLFVPLAA